MGANKHKLLASSGCGVGTKSCSVGTEECMREAWPQSGVCLLWLKYQRFGRVDGLLSKSWMCVFIPDVVTGVTTI